MLARVQEQCGGLLETTMAPQSGLQGFGFLGNSILAAVDQQLANSMPGALSCMQSCRACLLRVQAQCAFIEQVHWCLSGAPGHLPQESDACTPELISVRLIPHVNMDSWNIW